MNFFSLLSPARIITTTMLRVHRALRQKKFINLLERRAAPYLYIAVRFRRLGYIAIAQIYINASRTCLISIHSVLRAVQRLIAADVTQIILHLIALTPTLPASATEVIYAPTLP